MGKKASKLCRPALSRLVPTRDILKSLLGGKSIVTDTLNFLVAVWVDFLIEPVNLVLRIFWQGAVGCGLE